METLFYMQRAASPACPGLPAPAQGPAGGFLPSSTFSRTNEDPPASNEQPGTYRRALESERKAGRALPDVGENAFRKQFVFEGGTACKHFLCLDDYARTHSDGLRKEKAPL